MAGSQGRKRTEGFLHRGGALVGLGFGLLLCQGAAIADDFGAAPTTFVEAVWKSQEINFYYHSFRTFYPCDSLNDKVRRLLLELGAGHDLSVRSSGCQLGDQVALAPVVRIRLSSPVEATPQALAELEKTRGKRELIARMNGGAVAASGIDAQFSAHWKRLSIARGSGSLDAGDCELVDAFKRQVLPQLAVRVVKDQMRCTPQSYGPLRLEVEALTPTPRGVPTAAQRQPRPAPAAPDLYSLVIESPDELQGTSTGAMRSSRRTAHKVFPQTHPVSMLSTLSPS